MPLPSNLTSLPDEHIAKTISDLYQDIANDTSINSVLNTVPVIQIYQSEQQKRLSSKMKSIYESNVIETQKLRELTASSSRSATIFTSISLFVTVLSVIIAGFAIFLTVKANEIAATAERSSSEWQNSQLPLLKAISDDLQNQNNKSPTRQQMDALINAVKAQKDKVQ